MFTKEKCNVEDTAYEAATGKWSTSMIGYYNDEFIGDFVALRRQFLPHQNIGYFIRHLTCKRSVLKFYEIYGSNSQIVSIGSGYDTMFWLLRQEGIIFKNWYELDIEKVVKYKEEVIQKEKFKHLTHLVGGYHLISHDFNENPHFLHNLKVNFEFDENRPTLFIDEFSMIYFDKITTEMILTDISQLSCSMMYSAGMVLNEDEFGKLLKDQMDLKCAPLKTYDLTSTIENCSQLFYKYGFQSVQSIDYEQFIKDHIHEPGFRSSFKLEYLDDPQQIFYYLRHYSIALAGTEEFTSSLHSNVI